MRVILQLWSRFGRWSALVASCASLPVTACAANITTYHNDNLRTGWNQAESVLTAATVASPSFGLLTQVAVDEQVDAQPLFVAGQAIAGGTHDVVYVATENNTIYAIDAYSHGILASHNFGAPVPMSALPGNCNNNSDNVGINSTPVIDTAGGTLYAITYTYENNQQVFRLHAISLSTLQDQTPSVVVSASAMLNNGAPIVFNAAFQRQRPALLETSGNIYAGFGSFCDGDAQVSRGWVLGWNAATLAPLAANRLIDRRATSRDSYYMNSVWMSGYGIASDDAGTIVFASANSDPNGKAYNLASNPSESVLRVSADLTRVESHFTPFDHADRDILDDDLGSGGVLLLPSQRGVPPLAVVAGKVDTIDNNSSDNSLYLLGRNKSGGSDGRAMTVFGAYLNNGCWCGPSYFVGADGIGRVVTSTGNTVMVWKVQTALAPTLVLESTGPALGFGQDPGFMTSISSQATAAGSAVIWAVPHPANGTLILTAMDPANGAAQLFSGPAASWPFADATANVVPVVADGQVFIGGYQQVAVFGLAPPSRHVTFKPAATPLQLGDIGAPHELRGIVVTVSDNMMMLRTRTAQMLRVDLTSARKLHSVALVHPDSFVVARGDYAAQGLFLARSVLHAKDVPLSWAPDR